MALTRKLTRRRISPYGGVQRDHTGHGLTGLLPLAKEVAPGYGDALAALRASEAYRNAGEAFGRARYLDAAGYAAGGLAEQLTTIPVLGDVAMIGKAASVPLIGAMTRGWSGVDFLAEKARILQKANSGDLEGAYELAGKHFSGYINNKGITYSEFLDEIEREAVAELGEDGYRALKGYSEQLSGAAKSGDVIPTKSRDEFLHKAPEKTPEEAHFASARRKFESLSSQDKEEYMRILSMRDTLNKQYIDMRMQMFEAGPDGFFVEKPGAQLIKRNADVIQSKLVEVEKAADDFLNARSR